MKLAFCFPGQGSHEVGMGRAFAESVPAASAVFDAGSEASGLDLRRLCFEGPLEELTRTELQQPALVTASLACAAAVTEAGVLPEAVVGHSVGEYAALVTCGALTPVDAIRLVAARGRATAEAAREQPGSMAAVLGLDDAAVEALCASIDGVWPANYNCPGQVVVSGTQEAVDRFVAEAPAAGARRVVPLAVTGAFHSPVVASAAGRLAEAVSAAPFAEPRVPFVSTVTAGVEGAAELPGLLLDQLSAPVKFAQAVATLVSLGVTHVVEVGPGQVLAGLVRRCDRSLKTFSGGDPESLAALRAALEGRSDEEVGSAAR
jgi:[acyl-carrier-protein] S-malonyltransferase